MVLVAIIGSSTTQAAEIEFIRRATDVELATASRDAPKLFAAAAQAHMPVDAWVGTSDGLTAIRLVSQVICTSVIKGHMVGAMGACPVLIYQDLVKAPIWRDMAEETLEWPLR